MIKTTLPDGFEDVYPCRCTYRFNQVMGYTHWCHPECPFDAKLVGAVIVKGYRYVGWDYPGRPEVGCSVLEEEA